MQEDLNRVTLIGNVELVIETDSSLSFKMSTKEVLKDANTGERTEMFEHHMIVCSDELVNELKEPIFKGVRVFIDGAVRTRLVHDKEGKQVKNTEILANFVEVLRDEQDND